MLNISRHDSFTWFLEIVQKILMKLCFSSPSWRHRQHLIVVYDDTMLLMQGRDFVSLLGNMWTLLSHSHPAQALQQVKSSLRTRWIKKVYPLCGMKLSLTFPSAQNNLLGFKGQRISLDIKHLWVVKGLKALDEKRERKLSFFDKNDELNFSFLS